MNFIYNDNSLHNDPEWKKFQQQTNMNIFDHQTKNFKQNDQIVGSYIQDGYVTPSNMIDIDSTLRHGLIENPSRQSNDQTAYHFNSMPKEYNEQCNLRNTECAIPFLQLTTPKPNPQNKIHLLNNQGINTRHWKRNSDNFYKNVDNIELKKLF
jgi:hypothetical protein